MTCPKCFETRALIATLRELVSGWRKSVAVSSSGTLKVIDKLLKTYEVKDE